jgi:hypothetical protein
LVLEEKRVFPVKAWFAHYFSGFKVDSDKKTEYRYSMKYSLI